jgi:hypothetical protein
MKLDDLMKPHDLFKLDDLKPDDLMKPHDLKLDGNLMKPEDLIKPHDHLDDPKPEI